MSEEIALATQAGADSETTLQLKLADLNLYHRRCALEEAYGAAFELEPFTLPLQWRANWYDYDTREYREEGPMALADLIPQVEEVMGVRHEGGPS
jgi:hypothetical protein